MNWFIALWVLKIKIKRKSIVREFIMKHWDGNECHDVSDELTLSGVTILANEKIIRTWWDFLKIFCSFRLPVSIHTQNILLFNYYAFLEESIYIPELQIKCHAI